MSRGKVLLEGDYGARTKRGSSDRFRQDGQGVYGSKNRDFLVGLLEDGKSEISLIYSLH